MSTLIDQLRQDIQSARADLNRIAGQQETAKVQLEQLTEKAEELGFPPDATQIRVEVTRLEKDVEAVLEAVQEEVKALGVVVHTG
jgi:chromosome segregation ATPase